MKEQRAADQWQELSHATEQTLLNTQQRVCELEVEKGQETSRYQQMLADKDVNIRSMLEDVQVGSRGRGSGFV